MSRAVAWRVQVSKPVVAKPAVVAKPCINKCCKLEAKQVCAPAKTIPIYAPATYACAKAGHVFDAATSKCVSGEAAPAACPAGKAACSLYGKHVCVDAKQLIKGKEWAGLDKALQEAQCKGFAGLCWGRMDAKMVC